MDQEHTQGMHMNMSIDVGMMGHRFAFALLRNAIRDDTYCSPSHIKPPACDTHTHTIAPYYRVRPPKALGDKMKGSSWV